MAGVDFLRRAGDGVKQLGKLEPRVQKVASIGEGRAASNYALKEQLKANQANRRYLKENPRQAKMNQTRERQSMLDLHEARQADKVRGRVEAQARGRQRTADAQSRLNQAETGTFEDKLRRAQAQAQVNRGAKAEARANKPKTKTSNSTGAKEQTSTAQAGKNMTQGGSWFNPQGQVSDKIGTQAANTWDIAKKGIEGAAAGKNQSIARWTGGNAARGAVWGGIAGGTVSAAQGGDFWEGAKDGAFKGAVGWAGFKGVKAATHSSRNRDILSNAKNLVGYHSRDAAVAARSAAGLEKTGVSKAVDALMMNQRNAQVAQQTMNRR